MVVKNWKEAEERIREAMIPKKGGNNFAPSINKLRQSAGKNRQFIPGNPLSAS